MPERRRRIRKVLHDIVQHDHVEAARNEGLFFNDSREHRDTKRLARELGDFPAHFSS